MNYDDFINKLKTYGDELNKKERINIREIEKKRKQANERYDNFINKLQAYEWEKSEYKTVAPEREILFNKEKMEPFVRRGAYISWTTDRIHNEFPVFLTEKDGEFVAFVWLEKDFSSVREIEYPGYLDRISITKQEQQKIECFAKDFVEHCKKVNENIKTFSNIEKQLDATKQKCEEDVRSRTEKVTTKEKLQ